MLLGIKRLVTVYPHRPLWRMPRRLLLLSLVLIGLLAWLLGESRWPRHPKRWRDTTIEAGR